MFFVSKKEFVCLFVCFLDSFRMLKEQEPFAEYDTHSTSKNAKDKSNSATLWASQGGTHRVQSGMGDTSTRMLYCDSEKDSEKDSGYSGRLHVDLTQTQRILLRLHKVKYECLLFCQDT